MLPHLVLAVEVGEANWALFARRRDDRSPHWTDGLLTKGHH